MALVAAAGAFAVSIAKEAVSELVEGKVAGTTKQSVKFTFVSALPPGRPGTKFSHLDDNLKLVVGSTVAELKALTANDTVPTWERMTNVMCQNPLLTTQSDSHRSGLRTFRRDSTDWFKFDGSPDPTVAKQLRAWIDSTVVEIDPELKIISDALTPEDFNTLADVVVSTGVSVISVASAVKKKEHVETTIADIGLVRYPTPGRDPHFKLFRLKLKAWRNCSRICMYEQNTNGLVLELDSREYYPRYEVARFIREKILTAEQVAKLVEQMDSLLELENEPK